MARDSAAEKKKDADAAADAAKAEADAEVFRRRLNQVGAVDAYCKPKQKTVKTVSINYSFVNNSFGAGNFFSHQRNGAAEPKKTRARVQAKGSVMEEEDDESLYWRR